MVLDLVLEIEVTELSLVLLNADADADADACLGWRPHVSSFPFLTVVHEF